MRKATAIFLAIALGFPIGIWMASWQMPWWATLYIFAFFVSWFWAFGRVWGSLQFTRDAVGLTMTLIGTCLMSTMWPFGIWYTAMMWSGPNYWNKFDFDQRV